MGLDEKEFVNPERISKELFCPICTLVLENPVQTPSEHLFCEEELLEWMTTSDVCPITKENLNPGDSIYLKPNLKHRFYKKGTLLILRIGGKISGDVLYQMSMISEKNIQRLVNDNLPWFNDK